MDYKIQLVQVDPQPLAVVRRRASLQDLSNVVPQACGDVWKALRENRITKTGRNVAVYLDDEFNLEVGVEAELPANALGEVVRSSTPSGSAVTTMHLGPYNRLPNAHAAIRQWCATHVLTLAGPNWELYAHWENHWKDDPSRIRTDVFYLLKS